MRDKRDKAIKQKLGIRVCCDLDLTYGCGRKSDVHFMAVRGKG